MDKATRNDIIGFIIICIFFFIMTYIKTTYTMEEPSKVLTLFVPSFNEPLTRSRSCTFPLTTNDSFLRKRLSNYNDIHEQHILTRSHEERTTPLGTKDLKDIETYTIDLEKGPTTSLVPPQRCCGCKCLTIILDQKTKLALIACCGTSATALAGLGVTIYQLTSCYLNK